MDPIRRDLEMWIPRLIAAWRRARKTRGGPPEGLTSQELKEVGAAVRVLSHGLTRDRELAGARYMEDPRLLGAYLLFYWPVSYAQARHALRELSDRPREVLDLGSGPGPLAFACLDAGAAEVVAADRSPAALALMRELAADAGEGMATRSWNALSGDPLPEGRFDLLTMGHMLNELWAGQPDAVARRAGLVERAFARVKPQGSLLIVEPALRETSRALLEVRDRLVDAGHGVKSPCLFRGACPALVKQSDWCHAERSWEPPPLVQAIGRAAGLRKEALKMTYLLLAPKGEPWPELPAGRLFRIVSEPLASKGRQRYIGCGPEGRIGLAVQDKHLGDGNAVFARLERGDVIAVEGTADRGDGLALDDRSGVTVVARAGTPAAARKP
jgi:SAM-dependent methyltransferase